MSTKLEMDGIHGKGSPTTMVTWHSSRVASKKSYTSVFTGLMTTKLDKMIAHATMQKVAWFCEHVIICSLVTNKKRYISNSTSSTDIKLDRVVAYDLIPKLKKNHITLSKNVFPFMNFIQYLRNVFNLK